MESGTPITLPNGWSGKIITVESGYLAHVLLDKRRRQGKRTYKQLWVGLLKWCKPVAKQLEMFDEL